MSKRTARLKEWRSILTTGDRWEAPERGFVGHRDILIQSRARYEFVATRVRGSVLDVGCGRGYGFEILAPRSEAAISGGFLRLW
jgi:2-polyprenyl-3-methyl-5-hydroxy-6-metoxy-1,4-benzoquinol methylase